MPRKDHFVAETYLKHFLGPKGMLYAYRKTDSKQFPTTPNDICREINGDIIRDFLNDPTLLKQYRAMFEPSWNHAVNELRSNSLSVGAKLAISGYWANLLAFTPARRRTDVKMSNQLTLDALNARQVLLEEVKRPDLEMRAAVAALNSGGIRIETEPDAMRAMRVGHVGRIAWTYYNSDWFILHNQSGTEFITSDNPVAFDDPGPLWQATPPLAKYLPVAPDLCLVCRPTPLKKREPDFSQAPLGSVRDAIVQTRDVRDINRMVAQCAEELIITSAKNHGIETLARKYARHRVGVETLRVRHGKGFMLQYRDRVTDDPNYI